MTPNMVITIWLLIDNYNN